MVKECGRRWSEIVGAGRMEGIVGGEVVRPNMDMACAPRPYTLPLLSHYHPHPPSLLNPSPSLLLSPDRCPARPADWQASPSNSQGSQPLTLPTDRQEGREGIQRTSLTNVEFFRLCLRMKLQGGMVREKSNESEGRKHQCGDVGKEYWRRDQDQ